jgi:hypothetical protein
VVRNPAVTRADDIVGTRRVRAVLDHNTYPTGIRISDQDMRAFERQHVTRHDYHADWNYDLRPTADPDEPVTAGPTPTRPKSRQ